MDYRFHYDEAIVNYQVVEIEGIKCLFTEYRLHKFPIPGFLKIYELRHGDNPSRPATLEHGVVVNFFGTIITDHTFNLNESKTTGDKFMRLNRNNFKYAYEDDVCGTDACKWISDHSVEEDYDE